MNFRPAKLELLSLVAAAASGMIVSAEAQGSGQPILFSSPDNRSASEPADISGNSKPDLANMPQVPQSIFTWQPPAAPFPQSPPMAVPHGNGASMRDLLDQRKNWALLTPAEIMGVTMPGNILGLPGRDAAGRPKNLTVEQRFSERQARGAGTNGFSSGESRWSNFFSSSPDGQPDADTFNPAGNGNSAQILNRFLNAPLNNGSSGNQSEDVNGSKLFGLPPQPLQNPGQQAEMDRFRQLLEPSSTAAPATGSGAFSSKLTGNSSSGASLNSGADAPFALPKSPGLDVSQSLPVLPSVSTQNNDALQPVAPSWTPKPAPWLSPIPGPGTIPQRKF